MALLAFSGCDLLRALGFGEDDPAPEEPAHPYVWKGVPVDPTNPSIKAKFGVTLAGEAGVNAAFQELHAFIQNDGLMKTATNKVIKLGDWIELEAGLKVAPSELLQGDTGTILAEENRGGIALGADSADRLKLIVVGINSFRSGKGSYSITDNDMVDHVVFQFERTPGKHRMNATQTNDDGYEKSEMRVYLTNNFLPGLEGAGVPKGVLWPPTRQVSKDNQNAVSTLTDDLLWLPTARELFKNGIDSEGTVKAAASETAQNQTWLEYYTTDARCKKVNITGGSETYWTASIFSASASEFCIVFSDGKRTTNRSVTNLMTSVAPAFCVK